MTRAVARRQPPLHEDWAILTIQPLPQHEVHFPVVKEIVREFLVQHKGVRVRDIQRSHLGQVLVRFEHIYDRESLVALSPHPYGDAYFSFSKHNEGRNWRLMEYNRECWLMLLGFPLDFWTTDHIQHAIASFGRVLTWEDDSSNLTRLLVKARVRNLEDVPRHIVFTETEGFVGQSWTVQCEIIHQTMLGCQPADEDLVSDEDPMDMEPPFDFFGLGQPVNHIPFQGDQVHQYLEPDQEIEDDWGQWIDGGADAAPAANEDAMQEPVPDLNIPMQEPLEIDLNEAPINWGDDQNPEAEQGQISFQFSAAGLDWFSEDSVNLLEDSGANSVQMNLQLQNDEVVNDAETILGLPAQPALVPEQDAAKNALVPAQDATLLLPNDLVLPLDGNLNDQPPVNLNLQVGFMRFQDPRIIDPVFERFTVQIEPKPLISEKNVDLYRLWGKFFSPVGDPARHISVTINWAPFITANLLKKDYFEWASKLLTSPAWQMIQHEENVAEALDFSLPFECPDAEIACPIFKTAEASNQEPVTPEQNGTSKNLPSSTTALLPKKKEG
jgi:hypothetical protein